MSNVTQVANTNMDAFAGNPPSGVAGVILENSVADLSKGRLATNPKKGRNAFTILIVGERGVGKTSVLNLLYNILVGNGPDNFKPMNDYSNEGQLQGQTETAKAYDFTSKNGVKFLIIDTPGLNDPRGGGYDEIHKGSIAKVITEATTLLNAVLILANGTLARLSASTQGALNTLTEILPKELQDNISMLFTNCASLANLNFEDGGIPPAFANAPQYALDNPFALQERIKRRREERLDPDLNSLEAAKKKIAQLKEQRLIRSEDQMLERAYADALETFVEFFNQVLENTPRGTKSSIDLRNRAVALDQQIALVPSLLSDIGKEQRDLNRLVEEIEEYSKLPDETSKVDALRAQKMFLEHETTVLEAELRNTLNNITTIAHQYSAMNLAGDFVGGLNRSISLLQVQRKVYAQRDPDTAERIQKIIEVLMNEKAILKEVASRKATQKA